MGRSSSIVPPPAGDDDDEDKNRKKERENAVGSQAPSSQGKMYCLVFLPFCCSARFLGFAHGHGTRRVACSHNSLGLFLDLPDGEVARMEYRKRENAGGSQAHASQGKMDCLVFLSFCLYARPVGFARRHGTGGLVDSHNSLGRVLDLPDGEVARMGNTAGSRVGALVGTRTPRPHSPISYASQVGEESF